MHSVSYSGGSARKGKNNTCTFPEVERVVGLASMFMSNAHALLLFLLNQEQRLDRNKKFKKGEETGKTDVSPHHRRY